MAIVLASASPRRRELLTQIGCDFKIVTSDVFEDNAQNIPPAQLAVSHAKAKALAVRAEADIDDIIIGADTIVVLSDEVFGKPQNAADAKRILQSLSGREHEVITGVAVVTGTQVLTEYTVTIVRMAVMSDEEIENYIATGEPMDKAGAYAIQGIGALFVEGINGCYSNVVGLPLRTIAGLLKQVGVGLL